MNEYQSILTKYWGYAKFRPLQEDIIRSVASGRDTLGLMPTGGGKSVTFQVFSLSRPGMCIVVTPLIALMKDQVENLKKRGIRALAIHSGMTTQEVKLNLDSAVWGDYKFLYLSPERITTERFRERLPQMNVNLIVVDEAHCISQWGYDFRPSYLRILELREYMPEIPVLALTATATPQVIDDIKAQLKFRRGNVLKISFFRSNLAYLVREREDGMQYLLQSVNRAKGSGIIYVRRRKQTWEIAETLRKNNISADYYHAGLSSAVRTKRQDEWIKGETRIIVATNAFGMGIDKPDVRFVIHYGPPDSPEAYFQEAGRAGRDGKDAVAVIIYANPDKLMLRSYVEKAFPPVETIKQVYNSLCNYLQVAVGFGKNQIFDFSVGDFSSRYKLQINVVLSSLKLLQRHGYIELTDELDNSSRIHFTVGRDDLYRFQVANASFDGFIKLLLRSYTGMFTNYIAVDEDILSKRSGLTLETIYKFLNYLDSHKIIDFIPRKKTPFIIFTKERLDISRLKISKGIYADRKKEYNRRIEAMISYATGKLKCRSQYLLEYFGEIDSVRCGKCDVCMGQNELKLSRLEIDNITAQLREYLKEPCSFADLVLRIDRDEDNIIRVVRWLIDNGEIVHRIDNLLEWK